MSSGELRRQSRSEKSRSSYPQSFLSVTSALASPVSIFDEASEATGKAGETQASARPAFWSSGGRAGDPARRRSVGRVQKTALASASTALIPTARRSRLLRLDSRIHLRRRTASPSGSPSSNEVDLPGVGHAPTVSSTMTTNGGSGQVLVSERIPAFASRRSSREVRAEGVVPDIGASLYVMRGLRRCRKTPEGQRSRSFHPRPRTSRRHAARRTRDCRSSAGGRRRRARGRLGASQIA